MPAMTTEQRVEFLKHLYAKIFTIVRFPFQRIISGEIQVGSAPFIQMVTAYHNRVQQITTDPRWAPWVIGDVVGAKIFKCAELGAQLLIAFDLSLDLGTGMPYPIRVVEQNPFKRDKVGNLKATSLLAQRGHKIAWVIKTDTNTFLGKVQDGEFEANKPRAYTKTNFQPLSFGAGIVSQQEPVSDQYGLDFRPDENGGWVSELPDVDPNDVVVSLGL